MEKRTIKVSASILSADLANLAHEVQKVEKQVDMIHFDVMDGHFVPNITYGSPVLEWVRKTTKLPIEAHLMIENPVQFVEPFAKAGADMIIVHAEADKHLHQTISKIKKLGVKAGVALNPSTHFSELDYVIDEIDLILVMTVNPGFGGQKFIESMIPKIRKIKELLKESNLKTELEVDGGINAETGKRCATAGVDILVAGSYIYGSKDTAATIRSLKQIEQ